MSISLINKAWLSNCFCLINFIKTILYVINIYYVIVYISYCLLSIKFYPTKLFLCQGFYTPLKRTQKSQMIDILFSLMRPRSYKSLIYKTLFIYTTYWDTPPVKFRTPTPSPLRGYTTLSSPGFSMFFYPLTFLGDAGVSYA